MIVQSAYHIIGINGIGLFFVVNKKTVTIGAEGARGTFLGDAMSTLLSGEFHPWVWYYFGSSISSFNVLYSVVLKCLL